MKSKHAIRLLLAAIALSLFACKEYNITTKINSDGSCERIITVKSDSKNGEGNDNLFPLDKTWKKTTSQNPDDSLKYVETYSKKFNTVDDLNAWLKKNSSFKIEAALENKFRWFYTYFTYTETYKMTNPFKQLPLENYFSKDEIKKLKDGDINDELSKKLDKYGAACMLNELFDSLSVEMKKYPEMNPGLLKENESRLSEVLSQSGDEFKTFMEELEKIYNTKTVWELEDETGRIIAAIEKKAAALWEIQSSFTNNVVMPGLLLDTNSKQVEGNKLTWKIEAIYFTYTDYKMTAESRAANEWAMILTGCIALVFVLGIVYTAVKKRKSAF